MSPLEQYSWKFDNSSKPDALSAQQHFSGLLGSCYCVGLLAQCLVLPWVNEAATLSPEGRTTDTRSHGTNNHASVPFILLIPRHGASFLFPVRLDMFHGPTNGATCPQELARPGSAWKPRCQRRKSEQQPQGRRSWDLGGGMNAASFKIRGYSIMPRPDISCKS
jgi:hypothetical protein